MDQISGFADFEKNNSEAMRERALELIEEGGLLEQPEQLDAMLRNTVIHFVDGTMVSYRADRRDLADLVMDLEGDSDSGIVEISAGQHEIEEEEA